jgi:hypothetical protein
MINDIRARRSIAEKIGSSLNDLVRDRMTGLVEEPDITSRIGQRLEERFGGEIIEGYRVHVISETITSHGAKSLENPLGTDLYIALSVEDAAGQQVSKGVLVQAKREKHAHSALREQCRRMNLVTVKGSVVWLYRASGVAVMRSKDVVNGSAAPFDIVDFFDRVLKCQIGDRRKVPGGPFGNRSQLRSMLQTLGAKNAVWLDFERDR